MMSNLGPTSSLAFLVSIRSEKDPVKIRKFSAGERKIYLDWKKKHSQKNREVGKIQAEMSKIRTNSFIESLKSNFSENFIDKRK